MGRSAIRGKAGTAADGPASAIALALAAAVALTLWLVAEAPAHAAPKRGTVVEKPVRSEAPGAKRIRESLVRIYDPLPAEYGAHPPSCDWIEYLRFRHRKGPRVARRADAVIVAMPGFLGGSGSFDSVARNTVRRSAMLGEKVEFWALDRRANCLEDDRGVRAAARAKDPTIAWDYYWHGKPVNGKRFGGFANTAQAAFVGEFGLAHTMRDWETVLRTGIPGRRTRAKKVICGGHSLGGPLTAAFAGWDFDGDPTTTRDAGYNQCAGYVGFDTSFNGGGPGSGLAILGMLTEVLGAVPVLPYISVPPLTPETFQVPPVFGVGAYYHPRRQDLIKELPHTPIVDLSQRLLFSADPLHFALDKPSIREFTLTNEVALAGIFDDNSSPISILRASLGTVIGGPLRDKEFPIPGNGTLALPEDPSTVLYSWQRYRQVGRGEPIALNDSGTPYTSRESEVTDLRQFARSLFEAPANFIEQYFPTRLLLEVVAAATGDRGGSLRDLVHDGISKRPALLINAGDSGSNLGDDEGPPIRDRGANDLPLSRNIVLPGYNHLDVTAAAWRQNDGRPEPGSLELARFAKQVTR